MEAPRGASMPLSPAQLQTLKAAVAANTTQISVGGVMSAINTLPNNSDANDAIATWYNQAASPAYLVWNPTTLIKSLRAATDLSKFTPQDSPPTSTNTVTGTNDALLYQNRCLVCQLKQANAVFLIQGEGTVDASPQQFRQSFFDCMTSLPSGSGGAVQNAGWGTAGSPGAIRLAMQRSATNFEKLFSVAGSGAGAAGNVGGDPRGGTTNPDAVIVTGFVTTSDVETARNLS